MQIAFRQLAADVKRKAEMQKAVLVHDREANTAGCDVEVSGQVGVPKDVLLYPIGLAGWLHHTK